MEKLTDEESEALFEGITDDRLEIAVEKIIENRITAERERILKEIPLIGFLPSVDNDYGKGYHTGQLDMSTKIKKVVSDEKR